MFSVPRPGRPPCSCAGPHEDRRGTQVTTRRHRPHCPTSEQYQAARPRRRSTAGRRLAASAVGLCALVAAGCGSTAAKAPPKVSSTAVDALITAGDTAQQKGQSALAGSLYRQAVADAPKNAVALYDLGDLDQIKLHDDSAAEADYRRALAVDPRFIDARFNLAILESANDPKGAIAAYQTITGIDPTDADAYLNLGFLLRSTGQTTASATAFHKAVTLDPALQSRMSKPASAK